MRFSIVKELESYKIYNNTLFAGYYNITKTGCTLQEEPIQSGNFTANTPISFTPQGDGDYTVTMTIATSNDALDEDGDTQDQTVISHYPYLIKAVINDLKTLLCDDCGCGDIEAGCTDGKAKACLKSQLLLGNITFLMGVFKTINCDNTDISILHKATSYAIQTYKCELLQLFCKDMVDLRIRGDYEYDGVLLKKILSIYYLMIYFYEKEMTNTEKVYIEFLNKKYDFKTIKSCILKSEIDVSLVENLFTEIYYDACSMPDIVCDLPCFKFIGEATDKLYEFETKEVLNGIYDTVTMKNTCGNSQLFMNRVIYLDSTFKMMIKAQSSTNPTEVAPDEEFLVNIIFQGTKPVYTVLNIPLSYEGSVSNTYKIVFRDTVEETNTPPVIMDIIKDVENKTAYTFTIADFENYFIDVDGDILGKIVLVGDTRGYTLSGLPYISGTIITRDNIHKLTYTPDDTNNFYEVVINWQAFDSRGAASN